MNIYKGKTQKLVGIVDNCGDGKTWSATAINPKHSHDTKFLGTFDRPGAYCTTLDRAIAACKNYKFDDSALPKRTT